MRAVVQRVISASVKVEKKLHSNIERGLLVFLGIGSDDGDSDIEYLVNKIINLRIFKSSKSNIDASILEQDSYSVLVVSQFTLYGDCRKGRRPSFFQAASPELAEQLYESFLISLKESGINVQSGKYRAMMEVELKNDGPVTILLDSKKDF